VTGASGSLGRRVIALLRDRADVAAVVGLDRAEAPPAHSKLDFRPCDVRDPELGRHFEGCDAVFHLAFIVERGSRDATQTEAINVGGTRNVFEAAAAAGVAQMVYASSVAAYGFHPDTDGVLLEEDAETRGNDDFYYARHKAAVERWIDDFEGDHPEMRIARLRPSIFLGEDSPRSIDGLRLPFLPRITGPEPRVQITHQDDVADAFVLAFEQGAHGAYNVATDAPLSMREMAAALGKPSLPLPRAVLALPRLAWRLGLGDMDPVWLDAAAGHSLVVSSDKIRKELGWHPRHPTTADALQALAGRP